MDRVNLIHKALGLPIKFLHFTSYRETMNYSKHPTPSSKPYLKSSPMQSSNSQVHNSTTLSGLHKGPGSCSSSVQGSEGFSGTVTIRGPCWTTSEIWTRSPQVSSACSLFDLVFTCTSGKAGSTHWSSQDRQWTEKPSAAHSASVYRCWPALGFQHPRHCSLRP